MLDSLRRVVTGHNAVGRSVIEIDGPPANTVLRDQGSGVDDTGSDGLKFRMATSGIRAGALLCRRAPHGSPAGFKPACIAGGHCQVWKNMTPKVRSTRTTSAPLSRIPLMTADHHREA